MPRSCSICNLQEHLPALEQRLRNKESLTALGREYAVSPDALARHRKGHMGQKKESSEPADTLRSRLELLWQRSDELFTHATATGSTRTAVDALLRLTTVAESLAKLRDGGAGSSFEQMTVEQKVDYIRSDKPLHTALFDDCVRSVVAQIKARKQNTETSQ